MNGEVNLLSTSPSRDPSKPFSSTSTLLKEISNLRHKLRELEDDNKSTISSVFDIGNDSAVNIMRKEMSRVEQEKADLEKHFMNQMATLSKENSLALDALNSKLQESEKTNEELKRKALEGEKVKETKEYMDRLLDEQRKRHAAEVEKMQENLIQTDLEIAESRREMDLLQEKLYESEAQRENLESQMCNQESEVNHLQAQLDDMIEEVQQKDELVDDLNGEIKQLKGDFHRKEEEIREMNDEMVRREERKNMRVTEVADLRQQLQKVKEDFNRKQEEIGEMNDEIIRTEEHKNMLVTEVTDLRKQLQKVEQSNASLEGKLSSQHQQAQNYQDTVAELSQVKQVLEASQKSGDEKDRKIAELSESLESEQKVTKQLRQRLTDDDRGLSGGSISLRRHQQTKKSDSCDSSDSHSHTRLKKVSSGSNSFSSIVATFEKRIANSPSPSPRSTSESRWDKESCYSEGEADEADKVLVSDLRRQLSIEVSKVDVLRRKVTDLEQALAATSSMLDAKTEECKQDFTRSTKQIEHFQKEQHLLEEQLAIEQETARGLRAKIAALEKQQVKVEWPSANGEKDHAKVIESLQKEIKALRLCLHSVGSSKDVVSSRSLKDENVARAEGEKEGCRLSNQPEVHQLQSKVEELQSALGVSLQKIDMLERKLALVKPVLSDVNSTDGKLKKLKRELSKISMEKAGVELEYHNRAKELEDRVKELEDRVTELEGEIEVIELAAEEELLEKDREVEKLKKSVEEKVSELARIEEENVQLCCSMSACNEDIEDSRKELVHLTKTASSQQQEIESLRYELSLRSTNEEATIVLQNRIRELEEEIKKLNRQEIEQENLVDLKKENIELRNCIREAKLERRALHERLDLLGADKSNSRSAQGFRDRNTALKQEVEKLTKRLKRMEDGVNRFL